MIDSIVSFLFSKYSLSVSQLLDSFCFLQIFGSIGSVGSGLALGKEGPLVHTGACIASLLGQVSLYCSVLVSISMLKVHYSDSRCMIYVFFFFGRRCMIFHMYHLQSLSN